MPFNRQCRANASRGKETDAPVGSVKRVRSRSMSTSAPGLSSSHPEVASSTVTGSSPFFRELPRKMSAISVLMTARIPKSSSAGRMFARGAATKISAGDQHLGAARFRAVQDEIRIRRAVGSIAPIGKQLPAQAVLGGRRQKARRNDLIGVDIARRDDQRSGSNAFQGFQDSFSVGQAMRWSMR